jgi:methionine-rich copper-binding protein CopC
MTRFSAACALAGAATLALAPLSHALAHAYPQTATPPINGMVDAAPTQVAIEFDDELEPRFCSIAVTDSAGRRLDAGPAQVPAGDPKHLSVALKPLAAGTYTVNWQAMDTDTHKTSGHYTFMVMQ